MLFEYSSTGAPSRSEYLDSARKQLGSAIYDRLGRPVMTTHGLEERTTYDYGDSNVPGGDVGRVDVTDPRGDLVVTRVDAHGHVINRRSFFNSKLPTLPSGSTRRRFRMLLDKTRSVTLLGTS